MKNQDVSYEAFGRPPGVKDIVRQAFATGRMSALVGGLSLAVFTIMLVVFLSSLAGGKLGSTGIVALIIVGISFKRVLRVGQDIIWRLHSARRMLVLGQFAADNDWYYSEVSAESVHPGMLYEPGHHQQLRMAVDGSYAALPFQIANLHTIRQTKKSQQEDIRGIVRVTLPRQLPHVLLDSKQNKSWFKPKHMDIAKSQKLELEGDFQNYFTLYVPSGYERDALYFITPDLMQTLIDYGADYDIELVDNYLFIYSRRPFGLLHEGVMRGVIELLSTIGVHTHKTTHRYADAMVGNRQANEVAIAGQRLDKKATSISVGFVITILIAAYLIFSS